MLAIVNLVYPKNFRYFKKSPDQNVAYIVCDII